MSILEMIIRTSVAFVILYILCRILGKKLISQMTFFDFVAGITIGSITANIMFQNVALLVGITGLVLFCLFVLLIDLTVLKSLIARKVFNGEPTILIKNGKLLEEGMKKTRFNVDELLLQIRKKNVFYIDEVELAILETDGTISVLRKPPYLYTTQKDIQNIQPSRGLAQAFIINGQVLNHTLQVLGKDKEWLDQTLKAFYVQDLKEVTFAQIDEQGKVHMDIKKDHLSV